MNRMREHVIQEVDEDQDGMISLKEFMKSTQDEEFKEDKGWDVSNFFNAFIALLRNPAF